MELYKTLVREWRQDAVPIRGPAQFRYMHVPGMTIRNCYMASGAFRKIHIEYATAGNLEIVHHVAYPYPTKDVPIFGLDVLWSRKKPVMAIADFSGPMRWKFEDIIEDAGSIGTPRDLPAWGQRIFSPDVIFVESPDVGAFTSYVVKSRKEYAHRAACDHARVDHTAFHAEYCGQQRQNDKTRGVLAAAFGPEVAEAYMRNMFDM